MGPLKPSGVLLFCLLPLIAAEQDAIAIDQTLRLRHLPYGTVLDPVLANGSVVSYTRCGDSAIWTGHYLAAEAFRYRATGSPDALTNAHDAIAGITRLIDVTGTDLLARCAIPADSPYLSAITSEESANGAYNATLNGRNWVWIGRTSRDQYIGVFFGLAIAYELIADPQLRVNAAVLVTRMLNRLMSDTWNIKMPDGTFVTTFLIRPDQELALLQIGRLVNPGRFAADYQRAAATLVPGVTLPLLIDSLDQRSSYFKFNLAFDNLFHLVLLEPDPNNRSTYENAFGIVRWVTRDHLNAHFNMIDRALHGPNDARDAETRTDLDAWLLRPRLDVFVDWRGKVPACGADQACNPLPIAQRPPTDFLWQRSPFQLFGGGSGNIESAGIDYLLPYWMARCYGVIEEPVPPATQ